MKIIDERSLIFEEASLGKGNCVVVVCGILMKVLFKFIMETIDSDILNMYVKNKRLNKKNKTSALRYVTLSNLEVTV